MDRTNRSNVTIQSDVDFGRKNGNIAAISTMYRFILLNQ